MKRMLISLMLCLALLLAGCASKSSTTDYIGVDAAKEAALSSAGFAADEVTFTSASLTEEDGTEYYQVNFTVNGELYEFRVDALSGIVIDCVLPSAAAAEDAEPTAEDTDSAAAEAESAETEVGTTEEAGTTADSVSSDITADEARNIALADAGLSENDVTYTKTEPDAEDGQQVWEVEFYTADGTEYDYEISASTGEILHLQVDWTAVGSSGTQLTAAEAKVLALAQVPGASESDIRDFEKDTEDGHVIYEGEIVYNGMKYEFEIDADSGVFLHWEADWD